METPLITIKYSEYRRLMKRDNELKIDVYNKIIDSFRNMIQVNNFNRDIESILNVLIRNYELVINQLKKEGK